MLSQLSYPPKFEAARLAPGPGYPRKGDFYLSSDCPSVKGISA